MNNSLVELLEGLETLIVYTRNLILYPDEKKYRKIKITNIHYQVRATTQPCNNSRHAGNEGCMNQHADRARGSNRAGRSRK